MRSPRKPSPKASGVREPLPPHDHFTVVFEGNLRDIPSNPFMTRTPFGLPRHIGVGNAFEGFDDFCALRDELLAALRPLAECEIIDLDVPLLDSDSARYFMSMGEIRAARAAIAKALGQADTAERQTEPREDH